MLLSSTSAASQSYSHNYESFFGKDDRVGLYSQSAKDHFSTSVLQTIQNNTLLIDCGSSGKPSTAFVAKTKNGPHIISAAHNMTMAKAKRQNCQIGEITLSNGRISSNFKDSGMHDDAGYDIAYWPNVTPQSGFDVCGNTSQSSKYYLAQSLDGTGRLGLSPQCRINSIEGNLITTNCRGHYKASGAPLLSVTKQSVCVAGVFNAHSGRLYKYESYAARLEP
jgi:hypothetical protein